MKKTAFTFLLSLACSLGFGQAPHAQIDSLKHRLTMLKQGKDRVLALVQLSTVVKNVSPDSAAAYAQQALDLSRQIKFTRGEAISLAALSYATLILGDIPAALQSAFTGLRVSEENDYKGEAARCLFMLGTIYSDGLNDHPKAIGYFKKAREKNAAVPDEGENKFSDILLDLNLGTSYMRINALDSASFFFERTFYDTSSHFYWVSLMWYGDLQFELGNHQAALAYSQKAIRFFLELNDHRSAAEAFLLRALYHQKMGQADSCIFYARKSLEEAELIDYKQFKLKAATLLAEMLESKNAPEALRFYKIAKLANDEVYGERKTQDLLRIISNELERQREAERAKTAYRNQVWQYALLAGLGVFLLIAFILFRNNRQKQKANAVLEKTLSTLKSTQAQLIQSEKLASLGELTAGIAHEIQNPLNFVNNFAEVSAEMLDEMHDELEKGDTTEAIAIATDLKTNLEKINHHGQRASSIVKGMLEHSRASTGVKEPTDLNALADEYLRLAYHGLRAKDGNFNATLETHFEQDLPLVSVIPQDIGRVLLNLINNAFYAVQQRATVEPLHATALPFQPIVTISTKRLDNAIEIRVQDNGNGIPEAIREKIFQPFFTTKPTGQGTGLGLSLAYDIVTKGHGGTFEVESKEGEGSEFIITLPIQNK